MHSKEKPKSCSCRMCRLGRGRPGSGVMMKLKERAFRHKANIATKQEREIIGIATRGDYTD